MFEPVSANLEFTSYSWKELDVAQGGTPSRICLKSQRTLHNSKFQLDCLTKCERSPSTFDPNMQDFRSHF